MCCSVCGKVHIKDPLLLIEKSIICGNIRFPLKKYATMTICLTSNSWWYENQSALEVSLNKTNYPFFSSSKQCTATVLTFDWEPLTYTVHTHVLREYISVWLSRVTVLTLYWQALTYTIHTHAQCGCISVWPGQVTWWPGWDGLSRSRCQCVTWIWDSRRQPLSHHQCAMALIFSAAHHLDKTWPVPRVQVNINPI